MMWQDPHVQPQEVVRHVPALQKQTDEERDLQRQQGGPECDSS